VRSCGAVHELSLAVLDIVVYTHAPAASGGCLDGCLDARLDIPQSPLQIPKKIDLLRVYVLCLQCDAATSRFAVNRRVVGSSPT